MIDQPTGDSRIGPPVSIVGPIAHPPFSACEIDVDQDGTAVSRRVQPTWRELTFTKRTVENARLDPFLGRAFIDDVPVAETLLRPLKGPPSGKVRPLDLAGRDPFLPFNTNWPGYYHWLFQTMFAIWAIETRDPDAARVHLLPAEARDRTEMLSLLCLPAERFHFFADRSHVLLPCLTVSTLATSAPTPLLRPFGDHLRLASGRAPGPVRAIYVSRRDSPKRRLVNEREIEAAMAAIGVEPVVLTGLTLADKIALFSGCDLVVGPHGAGLAHMIFCRPGTRLVELFPGWLPNLTLARSAMSAEMDYTLVRFAGAEGVDRSWAAHLGAALRVTEDRLRR